MLWISGFKTRKDVQLLALALILCLAIVIGYFIRLYRENLPRLRLDEMQREIKTEIVSGMKVADAKSIMLKEYRANIVSETGSGDSCAILFAVPSESDGRGISYILAVDLECEGDAVVSVTTSVGGLGP
jgi:hypothetical protein